MRVRLLVGGQVVLLGALLQAAAAVQESEVTNLHALLPDSTAQNLCSALRHDDGVQGRQAEVSRCAVHPRQGSSRGQSRPSCVDSVMLCATGYCGVGAEDTAVVRARWTHCSAQFDPAGAPPGLNFVVCAEVQQAHGFLHTRNMTQLQKGCVSTLLRVGLSACGYSLGKYL